MRINALIFSRPLGLGDNGRYDPRRRPLSERESFRETEGEAGACFLRKAGFPLPRNFAKTYWKRFRPSGAYFSTESDGKLTFFFDGLLSSTNHSTSPRFPLARSFFPGKCGCRRRKIQGENVVGKSTAKSHRLTLRSGAN